MVFRNLNANEHKVEVDSKELVVGDVVQLEEKKLDVDIILLKGTCLVDESNLTGESSPSFKHGTD